MKTHEETVEALNEMISEIHKNAVKHGWWEEKRDSGVVYALIHSELSEALEEYRKGNPSLYCTEHGGDWCLKCYGVSRRKILPDTDCPECFRMREDSGKIPHKPEGIVTELADTVIRILDYAGSVRMELSDSSDEEIEWVEEEVREKSFGNLLAQIHYGISCAYSISQIGVGDADFAGTRLREEFNCLSLAVTEICVVIRHLGYDPCDIIRLKHTYNQTRPYKHGGKII